MFCRVLSHQLIALSNSVCSRIFDANKVVLFERGTFLVIAWIGGGAMGQFFFVANLRFIFWNIAQRRSQYALSYNMRCRYCEWLGRIGTTQNGLGSDDDNNILYEWYYY